MNKIQKIYDILLNKYGYQGWWPVTPLGSCRGDSLVPIYGISKHNEKQKLEIMLGAILTQNTSWKNVEKSIVELNKKGFIDADKIIKASHETLANAIKSSGYFNQKAKKLKNIADFIKSNSINGLEKKETNEARKLLLEVNGVGPETADSILLYALDKPIFVVDAYTKRIFGRLGFKEQTYEEFQQLFHNSLENDAKLFNEYHALIVELAKKHCKTKPICNGCPLGNICPYKKI